MFTNPTLQTTFFDLARSAAWETIEYLGERLRFRLHNTQKHLNELKKIGEERGALKKEKD